MILRRPRAFLCFFHKSRSPGATRRSSFYSLVSTRTIGLGDAVSEFCPTQQLMGDPVRAARRRSVSIVDSKRRKSLRTECEDWRICLPQSSSALVSVGARTTDKFLDAFGEPVDSAKRGALRFH